MHNTYWNPDNETETSFSALHEDMETDLVIVGGGLSGLLCAWQLRNSGRQLVVLEKNAFLANNSVRNTGKVCALQLPGISLSPTAAAEYFRLSLQAVDDFEQLIRQAGIDCGWQRQTAVLWAQSEQGRALIRQQRQFLTDNNAQLLCPPTLPSPLDQGEAIALARQGQLDPFRFQKGLLHALKNKVQLYDQTPVVQIGDHELITEGNYRVRFRQLIIATQFPAAEMKQLYSARLQIRRELIGAFHGGGFQDWYLNSADPDAAFSLRSAGSQHDPVILLAAPPHPLCQQPEDPRQQLQQLQQTLIPETSWRQCWSAQDCFSRDALPLIGNRGHRFLLTGYSGWGYTAAMMASRLIAETILDPDRPLPAFLRSDGRGDLFSRFTAENLLDSARGFLGGRSVPEEKQPHQTGMVVRRQGRRYGVVVIDETTELLVDLTCPHLGCPLHYNAMDQTWDCPCHGSRFTLEGKSLTSPSATDLQHYPAVNSLHPHFK